MFVDDRAELLLKLHFTAGRLWHVLCTTEPPLTYMTADEPGEPEGGSSRVYTEFGARQRDREPEGGSSRVYTEFGACGAGERQRARGRLQQSLHRVWCSWSRGETESPREAPAESTPSLVLVEQGRDREPEGGSSRVYTEFGARGAGERQRARGRLQQSLHRVWCSWSRGETESPREAPAESTPSLVLVEQGRDREPEGGSSRVYTEFGARGAGERQRARGRLQQSLHRVWCSWSRGETESPREAPAESTPSLVLVEQGRDREPEGGSSRVYTEFGARGAGERQRARGRLQQSLHRVWCSCSSRETESLREAPAESTPSLVLVEQGRDREPEGGSSRVYTEFGARGAGERQPLSSRRLLPLHLQHKHTHSHADL
ncbi:hypothetical protein EOD39_15149 [Acipenser ruthenus]|uniref:Uncharacterized protein n=1 Tax=Acipenser ruthenus TaxID=7906 RepID=A0A444TW06_ACIRT|nr:hypothetical protein EOD39_15149 [Acipenser ruthenus]